jgi:hypothetical protein
MGMLDHGVEQPDKAKTLIRATVAVVSLRMADLLAWCELSRYFNYVVNAQIPSLTFR